MEFLDGCPLILTRQGIFELIILVLVWSSLTAVRQAVKGQECRQTDIFGAVQKQAGGGGSRSRGTCQANIPALCRAPALLVVGLLYKVLQSVRVVPSDFAGTIESSSTSQPVLWGAPHCGKS